MFAIVNSFTKTLIVKRTVEIILFSNYVWKWQKEWKEKSLMGRMRDIYWGYRDNVMQITFKIYLHLAL